MTAVAAVPGAGLLLRRKRIQNRDDAWVLAALRENVLTPAQFEHALAALCRRDGGTEVRVVGEAGDLGADVIARAPDGRCIVLQAKRYRNTRSSGSQDVQRFGGTARTIHQRSGVPTVRNQVISPSAGFLFAISSEASAGSTATTLRPVRASRTAN